jgi:hypothetical protein
MIVGVHDLRLRRIRSRRPHSRPTNGGRPSQSPETTPARRGRNSRRQEDPRRRRGGGRGVRSPTGPRCHVAAEVQELVCQAAPTATAAEDEDEPAPTKSRRPTAARTRHPPSRSARGRPRSCTSFSFFSCLARVLTDGYRSALKQENHAMKPRARVKSKKPRQPAPKNPPPPPPPARRTTPCPTLSMSLMGTRRHQRVSPAPT